MKNLLKVVSLLMAVVIMSAAFSSCSGTDIDDNGEVYNHKNTLVIGYMGDMSTDVLYAAWDDYCQLNKNKNLKLHVESSNDFYNDEKMSLDKTPDISMVDTQLLFVLAQEGYFLNLDEFDTDSIKDQLAENSWDIGLYKSSVYGIPYTAYTDLFGAEKSAMDAAKVQMPQTYDEWLNVGEELKKNNMTVTSSYMFGNFYSFVWRLGGEILNEDGTEAVFYKPDTGVRVFEMLLEMKERGFFVKEKESTEEVFSMYATSYEQVAETVYFGLQPELKKGIPRYSVKSGNAMCIKKSSVNKDLAYDFIKFLVTGENTVTGKTYQEEFREEGMYGVPTLKDVQKDISGSSNFYNLYIEQLNCSKLIPRSIVINVCYERLSNACEAVTNGTKTPDQAVKDAQNEINAAIRRKLRE